MSRSWLPLCIVLALSLPVACKRDDPQAAAAEAAAKLAASEDAAKPAVAAFEDAVAKENWALAKAQADVLMAQYPGTQAAASVQARYDEVKAKADAARDRSRLAGLWAYNTENVKGGQQLSAAIYSKDEVDVDGSGPRQVRLIFRDHPDWGRSAYLTLEAGDFAKACYGKCSVMVAVDDAAPKKMAANRPKTDEAIAMFIDDNKALWRMTEGAKVMKIEFPTRDTGDKTAVFEVGGLDRSKLPKGWN